jgi:drug/metabolite transporter (DMT)-like permease
MNLILQGNVLMALAAALLWGGGDFSGGMGVKRAGGTLGAALRVVLLSHAASFSVLLAVALALGQAPPHGAPLAWGIGAGVAGGLSLTCFYIALSRGAMGASAAISGLLAAAIPAIVSMAAQGSPGALRLAGFVVAGIAIWMIAATPGGSETSSRGTMALAIASGAGFGIYFVALKMAGSAGIVWPMATARVGSLSVCSLLFVAVVLRGSNTQATQARMTRGAALWALSTAVMDTSGNLLFIAATRAGRLDIAAVLASLYPASTILLAAWMLGERLSRRQTIGMGIAAVAIGMISL